MWSSHREAIGKDSRLLINKVPIELPQDWQEYVDEPLTERELERLRESIKRQSPYGRSVWQIQLSKKLGLESTLRPRGRPRKKAGEKEK